MKVPAANGPLSPILAMYAGETIDPEKINEDYFMELPTNLDMVKDIVVKAITKAHGLTFEQIDKKSRKRELVEARHHLFYHMKRFSPKTSDESIGAIFQQKFDHSSVIHGKNTWQDLIVSSKTHQVLHETASNFILNSLPL